MMRNNNNKRKNASISRGSLALVLAAALAACTFPAPAGAIRVLWLGDDGKGKNGGAASQQVASQLTSPPSATAVNGAGSTDSLIQEALNNIDKLTTVARSLSGSKLNGHNGSRNGSRAGTPPPNGVNGASKTASAAPYKPGYTRVEFKVRCEKTRPGDVVVACGGSELGDWTSRGALTLSTSPTIWPFWTATIDIKQGTSREFKFAISRKGGGLDYEDGKNRVVPLKAGDVVAFLEGDFGATASTKVKTAQASQPATPARAASPPPAAAAAKNGSPRAITPAPLAATTSAAALRTTSPPPAVTPSRAHSPAPAVGKPSSSATVHFRIKCKTNPGESVGVCGSVGGIGTWDPKGALILKTGKGEYPNWSGEAEISAGDLKDCLRYKYVIRGADGTVRWEDGIADRVIQRDNKGKGALCPGITTFVDDGNYNVLQRVCTYFREQGASGSTPQSSPASAAASTPSAPPSAARAATPGVVSATARSTPPPAAAPAAAAKRMATPPLPKEEAQKVPEGFELVSMDQVKQWQARIVELEDEVMGLSDKCKLAEKRADQSQAKLEEVQKENARVAESFEVVKQLVQRMKKIEVQVSGLEETKQVLITRSESLSDLSAAAKNGGTTVRGAPSVYVEGASKMAEGLQGAREILDKIENRLGDCNQQQAATTS